MAAGLAGCGGDAGEADEAAGPPPVPDTFVVEGTSRLPDPFGIVEIESRELPQNAVLIGTEYAVRLNRYGLASELSEEAVQALGLRGETSKAPWRAGEGREFLLFHLVQPEVRKLPANGRFPSAKVLADSRLRQLSETALMPNRIVVVSVSAGSDATLVVTEDGQTRSISIRTGKVAGPQPGEATPGRSAPSEDEPAASGEVTLADYVSVPGHGSDLAWDALVNVEIAVELRAVDAELGAAAKGALWANVEVTLYSSTPTRATFTVDLSRSLTLRTSAGKVLRIPAGTTLPGPNPASGLNSASTVPAVWSQTFQVPKGTRKLSATYRTRGTVVDDKGKKVTFERRDTQNSGTITLE